MKTDKFRSYVKYKFEINNTPSVHSSKQCNETIACNINNAKHWWKIKMARQIYWIYF